MTAVPTISTIQVTGAADATSALTLSFDQAVTVDEGTKLIEALVGPGTTVSEQSGSLLADAPVEAAATPLASDATPGPVTNLGPTGNRLLCNNFYRWSDANGVFTLQHQCRGTTAPWGFWLSSGLASHVVGLVTETGMNWRRNGVQQPRMAPHTVGATYTFHGTFSNSPDGTSISYDDHFRFRHNIGPGGNADLHVFGSFVLTGTPPAPSCQPGSPC